MSHTQRGGRRWSVLALRGALCVCVCEAVEGSRCRPQACGSCDWGEGGMEGGCSFVGWTPTLGDWRCVVCFLNAGKNLCLSGWEHRDVWFYSILFFFSLYLTLSVFTLEKQGLCTCELYYWKWKWIKMMCGLILHLQCLNGLLTDGCSCHTSLLLNTKLMKHLIKMSFNIFFSIYSLTSHKTVWTLLPLRKTWKRPFILEQLYWKHGVLQNKTHLDHVL